jgi:uncharacterized protein involved in response to NO
MAQQDNTTNRFPSGRQRIQNMQNGPMATFFSHAFRPFFLGAGIYAALAMAAWLAWIAIHAAGAMPEFVTVAEPLHLWHSHEMVFGFAAASVGGFLLTAVPSWTGAPHSRGLPLGIMFAIWCSGRIAMWCTALLPPAIPMLVDIAFLPVLAFAAAKQLAAQPALRNVIFLSLILGLVTGNVLFHVGRLELIAGGMESGVRLGLGTLVVMIVVIGGRVIPAFTTNALRRRGFGEDDWPKRRIPVDQAALVLSAATVILLVWGASDVATGIAALLAAVVNLMRLSGWKGLKTLPEPIVWVLHLGYAWLVVGFALLSAACLLGSGSPVSGLHALGTGAIGTMTLAIMSRASLGHTGRGLIAARPVVIAYVLVSAAALLRCFGPALAPGYYNEIMLAAGLAWITAFLLFSVVFAPILLGPRAARQF